jgi:hypothetical protein
LHIVREEALGGCGLALKPGKEWARVFGHVVNPRDSRAPR